MEINKDLVKATGDITTGDISFSTIHSKNLLNFGGTRSQSKLGMTLSYNPTTGILTLNGTATAQCDFEISSLIGLSTMANTSYTVSSTYISGTTGDFAQFIMEDGNNSWLGYHLTFGSSDISTVITHNKNLTMTLAIIRIFPGVAMNNLQVKIQMEKGKYKTDFAPYKNISTQYTRCKSSDVIALNTGFSFGETNIYKCDNHYCGTVTILKNAKFTSNQETIGWFLPGIRNDNVNTYGVSGATNDDRWSIPTNLAYIFITGNNGAIYVRGKTTDSYVKFNLDLIIE